MRRSASASTFAEDPRADARAAEPSWLAAAGPAAHLVDVAEDDAPAFDLWAARGPKRLHQDGKSLTLTVRSAAGPLRATLGRGLEQGAPFGLGVKASSPQGMVSQARAMDRWTNAARCARAAGPDRIMLAHFRALLALDAKAAGASDLQIAAMFTAPAVLAQSWSPDSALRALVRDALRRGRAFRDRRWPDLVWPAGRRTPRV